jgi:hypothetical protein
MRRGNPQAWSRFSADAAAMSDNREAIDACRAALVRTGMSQRCVVTLTPPDASGAKPR